MTLLIWSSFGPRRKSVCMERENFDDAKSIKKRISDHYSSCLASIQPPPTHILPLPTCITAPAHQQRLRIGRVSGLVYSYNVLLRFTLCFFPRLCGSAVNVLSLFVRLSLPLSIALKVLIIFIQFVFV